MAPSLLNVFDLSGQVALVTGTTMGIGLATARVLTQAGAHVDSCSRKQADGDHVAQTLRDEGLGAEGRACHIGRMEDIADMSIWLQEHHAGLDMLINNAELSPWRRSDDTEPGLFAKTA